MIFFPSLCFPIIFCRYGANPNPPDGGSSAVLALLDKLTENGRNYVYQNVSCLQILLRNIPLIELPYKVSTHTKTYSTSIEHIYIEIPMGKYMYIQ